MKFATTLLQGKGKNVTGIVVPDDIVLALGGGKRPAVTITVNGYSYMSSIATMDGRSMISVSKVHREAAGLNGGDAIDVELKLETGPREVPVPEDFALALDKAGLCAAFDSLAYSHRKEHVRAIEEAKTAETRARRIANSIEKIRANQQ